MNIGVTKTAIRPAVPSDASEIAAIRREIVSDPWITFSSVAPSEAEVSAQIKRLDHDDHPVLVATTDEGIDGYVFFGSFRKGTGYIHTAEITIHLRSARRRNGVGRLLMAAVETQAQKSGVHVLVAGISEANEPAIAFHSSCGFQEVGRMPEVGRKNGQWHNLVLMQKTIAH